MSWDLFCIGNSFLEFMAVENSLSFSWLADKYLSANQKPASKKLFYLSWPNDCIDVKSVLFNSSPHSATYICQWMRSALAQKMWFRKRLVTYLVPSHYLNQCWVIVNWTLTNKLQWNFNQNTKFFIHENPSENIVCEMTAILSQGEMS